MGFSLVCYLIFYLTRLGDKFPLVNLLFSNFVLKALSEELMKYLLARKIIKRNHDNISFLDLMAYTTISAIGFELMESVVYLFSANVPQILVRGISSMHAAFGLIMGFIIAAGYKKKMKYPAILGIFTTVLIHGLYDLGLAQELAETIWSDISLFIAFFCLIINIANFFFMNKARKKSYYTDPLFPEEKKETGPLTEPAEN